MKIYVIFIKIIFNPDLCQQLTVDKINIFLVLYIYVYNKIKDTLLIFIHTYDYFRYMISINIYVNMSIFTKLLLPIFVLKCYRYK